MDNHVTADRVSCPLENIRLTTVLKINSIDVFHHTNNEPYYQISVGGAVLDGFGDPTPASIELSADDGDTESVRKLQDLYSVGSLHWLETSLFGHLGGTFQFYSPDLKPVLASDYEAINKYFLPRQKWNQFEEAQDLSKLNISDVASLTGMEDGVLVQVCCIVTEVKEIATKTGDILCFATAEDSTGSVSVTIFSDIYLSVSHLIKSNHPLNIAGRLEIGDQQVRILLTGSTGLVSIAN